MEENLKTLKQMLFDLAFYMLCFCLMGTGLHVLVAEQVTIPQDHQHMPAPGLVLKEGYLKTGIGLTLMFAGGRIMWLGAQAKRRNQKNRIDL